MLISELKIGGRILRNENRISIYQTLGKINTSSVFQKETKTSEREVLTEHAHKKKHNKANKWPVTSTPNHPMNPKTIRK